jgi:Protein of unknown function (DUF2911)
VEELVMRLLAICAVLISQWLFATKAFTQSDSDSTATVSCDFDDGKEISVQYKKSAGVGKDEPRNGKVWEPGGVPMTLYTQTAVILNHVEIGVGAFSMYVVPNRKDWTLIVNRNVTPGAKYDQSQDIVRAPMELGDLTQPVKPMQVIFGHLAPKLCSIRLYYGNTGAFAEFTEK